MKQHFSYDNNNNITRIDDGRNTKLFEYYSDNQLKKATVPGQFLETKATSGSLGLKIGDYHGNSWVNFGVDSQAVVSLDYDASSIGIDFGQVAPGVKKIVLSPDANHQNHRVNEGTFAIYVSNDNASYSLVGRDKWDYLKDGHGVITITFKERLATRYLKFHVKYDYRDAMFQPVNKATFLNQLAKMLTVYQEAASQTEEYQYDAAGNRMLQRITLVQATNYTSLYYADSDRLKTDGKFAYKYDAVGNLTEKGNTYTINGDTVTFTKTSGEGVEYWQYVYDLLNRLVEVKKNGTVVSKYGYSPDGLRETKIVNGETTHYVFQDLEPIFVKNVTTGKIKSYIFVVGKRIARIDGVIGDTQAEKWFYVNDHLGSIRVVTNKNGSVAWVSDYLAFGNQYGKNKIDSTFEEDDLGFNGKEMDQTGLVYMNARWYDPDTGRFVSEDAQADQNNPNLYSFGANNPLTNIDPTGFGFWSSVGSVLSSIGHAIGNAISNMFSGTGSYIGGTNSGESGSGNNGGGSNIDNQGNNGDKTKPVDPTPKDPTTSTTLDQAKIDYSLAADVLESAKKNKDTDPDGYKKAVNDFNKALDNLIGAAGFDTKKYNHNTVTFRNANVNAKADIIIKTVTVGNKLNAASMIITEGLRTKEGYYKIYPDAKPDAWKKNQHCQGNAVDVTFFKSDGTVINKFTAAKAAATIPGINGIGTYNDLSIIHIDLRDDKYNWYRNDNTMIEHSIDYKTNTDPANTVSTNGW